MDEKDDSKDREEELLLLVKELVIRAKENKSQIELLSKNSVSNDVVATVNDNAILYKEADTKSIKITELTKDTEIILLDRIVLKKSS